MLEALGLDVVLLLEDRLFANLRLVFGRLDERRFDDGLFVETICFRGSRTDDPQSSGHHESAGRVAKGQAAQTDGIRPFLLPGAKVHI